MPAEEIVVPFDSPRIAVRVATSVRSTVLLTSQRALRSRGLLERYMDLVDPSQRDAMRAMTAGAWLPLEAAIAHYSACEMLRLDRATIESIGSESGRVLNQTVLSVVVKLSKEAGVSPWSALAFSQKLRARTWQGSSLSVTKLGPKEARFEWIGQPVAIVPYFRTAFGAFVQGVLTLFARVVFVREVPALCTKTSLGFRCSWV